MAPVTESENLSLQEVSSVLVPKKPIPPGNEAGEAEATNPAVFNPFVEVRKIRSLTEEQKALPLEERRNIRRRQFETFIEALHHQEEGIVCAIEGLRATIHANPDVQIEELMTIVEEYAGKYKFYSKQKDYFRDGIAGYVRRHEAVEKYRALYPDDSALYEACFGRGPRGEVVVEKDPMTLFFKCLSPSDYAVIRYLRKNSAGQVQLLTEEELEKGDLSGAVALHACKIPELDDTVTALNVSKCFTELVITPNVMHKEVLEKGERVPLRGAWLKNDVVIRGPDGCVWRIRYDEDETPLGYTVICEKAGAEPVVFVPDERNDQILLVSGNKVYGAAQFSYIDSVVIDANVENTSGERLVLNYLDDDVSYGFNPQAASEAKVHEITHQENKLFDALWHYNDLSEIIAETLRGDGDPDKVRAQLIHSYVRLQRRELGIDRRAADEILAYYEGGTLTGAICKTLLESPLYDYRALLKDSIKKIPWRARVDLEELVEEIYTFEEVDAQGQAYKRKYRTDLDLHPEEVVPYVDAVFGEEYKESVKKWTAAVERLEEKGYSRAEVVDLLRLSPVHRWSRVAAGAGFKLRV